jgi:hypothetical protein
MKITRENYEPFFLDFLEGNLKVDQIDQFLDFLNQNPDLKEELQLFESINIPEEQMVFSEKSELYRGIGDEKSGNENRIIAYLEGDLKSEDRILFEDELAVNPGLEKEYNLFGKTRLFPDKSVTFTEKHKIHRKTGTTILVNWMARIAALILILWGINSIFQSENKPVQDIKNQALAEIRPTQTPLVEKEEIVEKSAATLHPKKVETRQRTISNPVITAPKIIPSVPEEILAEKPDTSVRDNEMMNEIPAKQAPMELKSEGNELALSTPEKTEKVQTEPKVMSLDEFLVDKAKKVSAEGLLSAQRFARAGMDAASELSGERIGFVEKNGKVEKIRFESKILAFSIPLKKK